MKLTAQQKYFMSKLPNKEEKTAYIESLKIDDIELIEEQINPPTPINDLSKIVKVRNEQAKNAKEELDPLEEEEEEKKLNWLLIASTGVLSLGVFVFLRNRGTQTQNKQPQSAELRPINDFMGQGSGNGNWERRD